MAAFQTLLGLGTMHGSTHYDSIRSARDLSKRLPKANHNISASRNNRISRRQLKGQAAPTRLCSVLLVN